MTTKKKATKEKASMTKEEKMIKKILKVQEKQEAKFKKIGEKCKAFEKEMRELCKKHGVDMIGQAWLKKEKTFFAPVSEIKCELKFTALIAKGSQTFSR